VRGPGSGDGAGRAGGPVGTDFEQGRDHDDEGGLGGGESGGQADLDHRRDGCRRGRHRGSGRDPLRGTPRPFGGVYACSTLGQFLREFTQGHTRQLASVARAHLVNLVERSGGLRGIEEQVFIDIDSLLRPVFGRTKQGASFGHTKIAGRRVLRRGPVPAGHHHQHR
jgi:hypothetical protein